MLVRKTLTNWSNESIESHELLQMKKENPALGWNAMVQPAVQVVERSFARNDLVVPLDNSLNTTRQCTLAERRPTTQRAVLAKE